MSTKHKLSTPKQGNTNRKQDSPKLLTKFQLFSCYAASLLIIIFSLLERNRQIEEGLSSGDFYILLAVIGVAGSVIITLRQQKLKKEGPKKPGNALQHTKH